jgi:ADP-ribose pyrophosphatase YjhB (NUDIX family)
MKRAVVVLVKQGDKHLMGLKKDVSKWTFPAGHIDHKETPREAAKRELFEETGLKGHNFKLLKCEIQKPGVMIFLFSCCAHGTPTNQNDPDKEFSKLEWKEKNKLEDSELHIPKSKNIAFKV